MHFLNHPTRHLLLTGKGGVGKTSLACAAAIRLADRGRRVLLVSTDPASNLDEVLGVRLGTRPTEVPQVPGLRAMNLDPVAAAAEYRERMVSPYRGILPEAALRRIEEQYSGSCTLEIAAFDEFSRLIGDAAATADYDHIIFDTAPTGHTLRLLNLPSAWSEFMETNTTGTSCLGPLSGLEAQQQLYRQAVASLADPATTTLVLVTRPEPSALAEAERTRQELAELGIGNQQLAINGVFEASDTSDPWAVAMQERGRMALQNLPPALKRLPQTTIPLTGQGTIGIEALRQLGQVPGLPELPVATDQSSRLPVTSDLNDLIDDLAGSGNGVIMTMGKGGVGKTTTAAAIAVALAERGRKVHLTTTDPAAHLDTTLAAASMPHLTLSRIDPRAETRQYSLEVMRTAGADLDPAAKALLAEDLRSPCTEEIAVFRAFAEAVAAGQDAIVVLDTAPTGHTILLLDAALAYHREVNRQASQLPASVEQLLARLRDANYTRVLIVTLPEATPVHEAARLQEDLRRAGIDPFAWVVNQSLQDLPLRDATLRARREGELPYLREVIEQHAQRAYLIPWRRELPRGRDALLALSRHRADSACEQTDERPPSYRRSP